MKNLPIKSLLTDFCGNPTPFKCIGSFTEDDSIESIENAFQKSDLKRKVVEITTSNGAIVQLGQQELQDRIEAYLIKHNPQS